LPGVVDQEEKILKPFLPGFTAPNKIGYKASLKSVFSPEKSAGVDSIGILTGAIGMTSIRDKIVNMQNVPFGKLADQYFSMKTPLETIKPLDNQNYNITLNNMDGFGKPDYYPAADGNIGGAANKLVKSGTQLRLTMKDIERMTTVVPDIAMIRKGDLIVQYKTLEPDKADELNTIELGIVVGLGWETENAQPNYGDPAQKWWSQVFVVHVRQSLQQVTLGSWGNSDGMFGGFTDKPETCQIRRLLEIKDGVTTLVRSETGVEGQWDIVTTHIKLTFNRTLICLADSADSAIENGPSIEEGPLCCLKDFR
jgi:hypothetical protein